MLVGLKIENLGNRLVRKIGKILGLKEKTSIGCGDVVVVVLFIVLALSLAFEILIPTFIQLTHFGKISNAYIYSLNDGIFISIISFNLGISSIYILNKLIIKYNSSQINKDFKNIPSEDISNDISKSNILSQNYEAQRIFLKALKGNYYKVAEVLLKVGELNQAELGVRTNIPKSTLSRIVVDLEKRGLIIRYKIGMSKMIKLSNDIWPSSDNVSCLRIIEEGTNQIPPKIVDNFFSSPHVK